MSADEQRNRQWYLSAVQTLVNFFQQDESRIDSQEFFTWLKSDVAFPLDSLREKFDGEDQEWTVIRKRDDGRYVLYRHKGPNKAHVKTLDNRGRGISFETACERLAEGLLNSQNPFNLRGIYLPTAKESIIKEIREKFGINLENIPY